MVHLHVKKYRNCIVIFSAEHSSKLLPLYFQYEIEQALTLGVPPEKIFYAMPFKPIEHCQYACARGVGFVVVSCVEEVEKIAEFWPGAK